MGTTRNNFAAVIVLLVLMPSTSRSLSVVGNENSWRRTSSPDTLTPGQRSTSSSSIYECLFVDPDLPVCDVEWMQNFEEDTSNDRNFYNGDSVQRSRRNADVSTMDVVVYTIEGCLPSRLPFSMPSCDGISLDRIVDVQRFRPFIVKGLTKPPFVFPKFDYSQWLRMMKRLRAHVSSKARDGEQRVDGFRDSSVRESSAQDRTEELINAATMNEMMPNAIAASMNNSNGSSPNKFIPGDSDYVSRSGSTDQLRRTTGNGADLGTATVSSSSSEEIMPPILQFRKQFSSMESGSDESRDSLEVDSRKQQAAAIPTIPEIPTIPRDQFVYKQPPMYEPSNHVLSDEDAEKFLELHSRTDNSANGIADDFSQEDPYAFLAGFRRKREIRLPVAEQGIAEEPKSRGIAGKSSVSQFQNARESPSSTKNRFAVPEKQRKQSKSLKANEQGIAAAIPFRNAGSEMSKGSRGRIYSSSASKMAGQKRAPKKMTFRKKYRNRMELLSSRSH